MGGDSVKWFRKSPETKSLDVLPEDVWDRLLSAQLTANMDLERAVGLPAVLSVLRLISHAAGLVPMLVLRGEGAVQERARDTWQWRLLHRRPGIPPATPFTLKADLALNFTGRGNAFIRKFKPLTAAGPERPRVLGIQSLNADQVKPRSVGGAIVFDDATGERPVERGTDEIIHIRTFSATDGLRGLSPITAARVFVGAGLRRNQVEDNHLRNGIFPGMALKYPPSVSEEQARKWIDFLEARHRGPGKAGKVAAVGGGAELVPIPISLEDALFAEMTRLTIEQAASMWQVPLALVTQTKSSPTDDDWRHFITFALGPIFTALAEALTADEDFFAVGVDDELYACADPDALIKLDALKKAQVQREQIQTGVRLVDELRAEDGFEPLPPVPADWAREPGKVPQITPVGGAPNPTASTPTEERPPDEAGA